LAKGGALEAAVGLGSLLLKQAVQRTRWMRTW